MKNVLLTLLALLLVMLPYAMVTFGMYLLAGTGWALISLGILILLTVLVVAVLASR